MFAKVSIFAEARSINILEVLFNGTRRIWSSFVAKTQGWSKHLENCTVLLLY